MSNEQTIKDVYAARQRGDVAAIVALVADDVDWRNDRVESRECPWNGDFSGKTALPGFFTAVGENLELTVFDVKAMVASGPHIAVYLRTEGKVLKNGRPWASDVIHFWTFNDSGQIAAYRHFNDTAMELTTWRG